MAHSVEDEIRELRSLLWSERDPEGRVFAPLADAYRRLGDLAQAVEVLEEGLARLADFAPGQVVAGWVRRDQGDHAGAVAAFETALTLDEENAEALRALDELGEPAAEGRGPAPEAAPLAMEEPLAEAASPWSETGSELAAAPPTPGLLADESQDADSSDDGPVTRTMADLYARQGLLDRALAVYRRLLERDPDDVTLRERVAELETLAGQGPGTRDAEVEALARDWAEGPGDTSELITPFAWAPAAATSPGAQPPAGPPIREYLDSLLAWGSVAEEEVVAEEAVVGETQTPLAESDEGPVFWEPEPPFEAPAYAVAASAGPVAEAMLEVEVEAEAVVEQPAEPGPEPGPEPGRRAAVPIASLAPDAVDIASLAPDAVDIASLAPDAVDIALLAPDAVDIASLAPDPSSPTGDTGAGIWPLR